MLYKYLLIILLTQYSQLAVSKSINDNNGIALKGYDLISYFDSNSAIKGKKEFSIKYNQSTYLFNSEQNLSKFKKNPEKFLPAFGGWCAWAMAESGDKVDVDPKSFLISEDITGKKRLLLFYDGFWADTKKKWLKKSKKLKNNQRDLIQAADKNWEKGN